MKDNFERLLKVKIDFLYKFQAFHRDERPEIEYLNLKIKFYTLS
jgi:hypothetical protein